MRWRYSLVKVKSEIWALQRFCQESIYRDPFLNCNIKIKPIYFLKQNSFRLYSFCVHGICWARSKRYEFCQIQTALLVHLIVYMIQDSHICSILFMIRTWREAVYVLLCICFIDMTVMKVFMHGICTERWSHTEHMWHSIYENLYAHLIT